MQAGEKTQGFLVSRDAQRVDLPAFMPVELPLILRGL